MRGTMFPGHSSLEEEKDFLNLNFFKKNKTKTNGLFTFNSNVHLCILNSSSQNFVTLKPYVLIKFMEDKPVNGNQP